MAQFIETLENRMFLSASGLFTQAPAPVVHAVHAVHSPKVSATMLQFTGYATDANGVQTKLVLTISLNADGTGSGLVVHTNSDKTTDSYTFKLDKTGHFAFGQTGKDFTLSVTGQLSADHKSVTGNFMSGHQENGATVSDAGTFLVTAPSQPAPNPTTVTTGTHYTGAATDSDGKTSKITLDIFKAGGFTFGTVTHTNAKGVVDTVFSVKFDANGHFIFTGDNKLAGMKVEGQLSADKRTIVGNFNVPNDQGVVSTGTFTLNLA